MLHRFFILILSILLTANLFAQNPITITDRAFKTSSSVSDDFYYSFAEGDIIVVDLTTERGSSIKSFEIIELPYNSSKYSSFNSTSINQKQIEVNKKAVYLFRIYGGNGGKYCNLKIARIPKDKSTEGFNTEWKWGYITDTTYVTYQEDSLVGSDTISYTETKKVLSSEEIREENIVNSNIEIKSIGIIDHDNPREKVKIELPRNLQYDNKKEEVVAWAYWIGVGDNSDNVVRKNMELIKNAANMTSAIPFVGKYSALAGYAVGIVSDLYTTKGDYVQYYLVADANNANLFMKGKTFSSIRSNNVSGAFERFLNNNMLQGTYYICLYNDNLSFHKKVKVLVSVVIKTQYFRNEEVQKSKVVPRYVKVERNKMQVTNTRTRVPVE